MDEIVEEVRFFGGEMVAEGETIVAIDARSYESAVARWAHLAASLAEAASRAASALAAELDRDSAFIETPFGGQSSRPLVAPGACAMP